MHSRITFITIAVADLEKSLAFYRDGLGLATKGIVGTEYEGGAVVFFNLKSGLILALYPRKELAKDAKVAVSPSSPAEFSIGHNVRTKDEVDAVMEHARKAGATITKPAEDTFWGGYAGYFQDPDGHLWEIAWNPQMLALVIHSEQLDHFGYLRSGSHREGDPSRVGIACHLTFSSKTHSETMDSDAFLSTARPLD